MNKKIPLFFLFSLLICMKSMSQVVLPQMVFDAEKKGPNTIYYKFYNGIQMIEIDYNNYEKARVDFEDAIKPINSIRPRNYGHNTIILRNEKGKLLHQYNLRSEPFKASDFIACDKPTLILTHLGKITSNYEAKSNYPSFGKYRYYVTENNKAGVIDTLGNPVLEVIYDGIQSYNYNFKMNSYTTMYGFRDNETKASCIYTMQRNKKWGFKNDKITIQPKYEELLPLKENVLRIKKSNQFGLLNYKEETLLAPLYSDLFYKNDFYLYTKVAIENQDKSNIYYGIIDAHFKLKTQPIYRNFEDIIEDYYPSGNYWALKTNGNGAIDKKGNEISVFKYGEIPQNPYQKYYRTNAFTDANKRYILDLNFKEIGSDYNLVYDWKNALLTVKKGTKYGLIDLNNKVVLPCEYDSFWETSNHELGTLIKDKKYGVISDKGIVVIPCKYDYLYFVDSNKIVATLIDSNDKNNRKVGLLDENNKLIASFIYNEIQSLDYGFYRVKIGDKYGILNKDGKEITPIKYDEIYSYQNGFCSAKIDFGYGYINLSGKEITHFYYEKPTNFNYDANNKLTAKVVLAGKEIVIDENGRKIE
jgi:WG containing repeat